MSSTLAQNAAESSVTEVAQLSRTLRARHLTMISIGGIIGAGLFVGSSAAIAAVGPAVVLSYALAGGVVLLVMRMLGEMALRNPHAGAFTEYVRLWLGHMAGFVSGWLYWYFWVVVVGIEAIAGATILHQWFPLPQWQIGLVLMLLLTAVNLASARSYGEFEFWFSSIKVAAIVAFIAGAGAYVGGLWPGREASVSSLVAHGGFAPFGLAAVLAGMTTVIFSVCGAEIVTVAAVESSESERTIARMTSTLVLRILLFYVASITLILCIVPWNELEAGQSSFAVALGRMGVPAAAFLMDLIVLTAVLSCLNSGLYVTARVLFQLAARGDAPRALVALNARRVPARAILLGSAFGYLAVIASVLSPSRVFAFLVNASGAIMLVIYLFVCLAQLRSRAAHPDDARIAPSRMWLHPYLTWLTFAAIVGVLVSMAFVEGLATQLYASLVCCAIVVLAYFATRRPARA